MSEATSSPTPNNVPTRGPLLDTPQVLQTLDQPYAAIPLDVPVTEIRSAMQSATEELTRVLQEQNIFPNGPFFTHHFQAPDTHFHAEVCFPTPTAVTSSGRVVQGVWPSGTVARIVYTGDYSGLAAAWGDFSRWVKAHHHKPAPGFYERYVEGPRDTPDASSWKTELNIPLLGPE